MLANQLLLTLLFPSSYLTKPDVCQPFYRERAAPIHKPQIKAKQIHYCYCGVPTSDRSQRFLDLKNQTKGESFASRPFAVCLSHYSSSDSPPFILLKSSFHPVPRLLRSGSPFTLVPHWLERHREASNLLTGTDGWAEAHNGGSRASSPCSWPSKEKPKAGVWPEGRFN